MIHQRHRQTDGQTTCDLNTALCTIVHRAVKIPKYCNSSSITMSVTWWQCADSYRFVRTDKDGEAGEMTDVTWRMCPVWWRHFTVLRWPIAAVSRVPQEDSILYNNIASQSNKKAMLSHRWPRDALTRVNKQPHLHIRSHDSRLTQFNRTLWT